MTTKKPYTAQPSETVDFDELMRRLDAAPSAAPAVTPERSTIRAVGDVGLSLGQGAVGAFKALTDLGGASNPVSQGLGDMGKFLGEQKSAQSQATLRNSMERIQAAENSGSTLEEVKAYMGMLWDQPGEMLAQGVGSFATLGLGKAAAALKLAGAAKAAGVSKAAFLASPAAKQAIEEAAKFGFKANVGIGAGMGVGAVKGSQYEQTEQNALKQGMSPEEAQALATEAQAYGGPGTMQQVLGGGLGGLAAATGPIERLVAGRGAKQAGMGPMAAMAKGFAVEGSTEGAQGAQERFAGNTAAIDAGVLAPEQRMRGVAGQLAMEGTIGGFIGAAAGPFEGQAPVSLPQPTPGDQIRATEGVPEAGPMTRAANLATEQKARSADAAAISQEQAGGMKRTFDPRAGVAPPMSLTPLNAEGGILYEEPAPKPFGQNFTMPGDPQQINPLGAASAGGLTAGDAPAGGPLAATGTNLQRRPAEFTDVEPIAAAAGQIETPRRLGESAVFDVDAREVNTDQQGIATPRRLPFTDANTSNGLKLNGKGAPFPNLRSAQIANRKTPGEVVEVQGGYAIRPQQKADGAPANEQPATEAKAQPAAADAAGRQPVPSAQGQELGALSGQPSDADMARQAVTAAAASGVPTAGAGGVQADGVKRSMGRYGDAMTITQADAKVKELEKEARDLRKKAGEAPTKFMETTARDGATRAATLARKLRDDIKDAVGAYSDARAEFESLKSGTGGVQADGVAPAWADMTPDQRKRSRLEQEIATGKTNNGGVMASLRPAAIEKRKQELAQMGDAGRLTPPAATPPAAPAQEAAKSEQVAAQDKPTNLPQGIKQARAKKAAEAEAKRADHFIPGNIVQSYGGHDRVLGYTPADASGNWSVRVQAVVQKDGQWVDAPREPARSHSTPPDASSKVVQRAPAAQQAASPTPQPDAGPDLLGRNSQPFSEGGKPFKSEADAKTAKKLHPTKRVMKVNGGYALADKTPKQIAADAAKAKRLRQFNSGTPGKPMSAHEFVVSEGGMSAATRSELGVDGNPRVGNRTLFAGQGKPGLTLEQAAMKLKQAGYITDESESSAADIIKRSLTNPQYTPDGVEAVAEAEREAEFQDYVAAEQASEPIDDWTTLTDDELADTGYSDYDENTQAEIRALVAQLEGMSVDAESILEDVAQQTINATQKDYENAAKAALEAAIEGSEASRREDSGQAGAEAGRTETTGVEGLTAPTRADIEAQQVRAEQAQRQKGAADRAAQDQVQKDDERKRIAQASVAAADTFELGQDPLQSLTGQQDIFGGKTEDPADFIPSPEAAQFNTSYTDGQVLQAADLLGYFDEVITNSEKGARVKNPRFHIGEVDAGTASEIATYIEGYDGKQRRLRVSGRTLKHVHESRPAIAREIVEQLPGMFSKPDEVLPDPRHVNKRALLVKERKADEGQPKQKSYVATVEVEIEVEVSDGFIDIVTIMTAPDRSLREARDLKKGWSEGQQRTEQAVNSPHPLTPQEGANPAADFPDARPATRSVPPTPQPAQTEGITAADVTQATADARAAITSVIDAMQVQQAQKIAAGFFPSMGLPRVLGKKAIKATITDKPLNLLAAASEFGAELSPETKAALQAEFEGRVMGGEVGAKPELKKTETPKPASTTPAMDAHAALYRKTAMAQGAGPGISQGELAQVVDDFLAKFGHQAPVVIADSAIGTLPGVSDGDEIAGAVHRGRVHLFLDQIPSRVEAVKTLWHETLHYGLRRFLTKEQFIKEMLGLYRSDMWVRGYANKWVRTTEGAAAVKLGGILYARARGVDEALANLAEQTDGGRESGRASATVFRAVTNWLASMAERLSFPQIAAMFRGLSNSEAKAYVRSVFQKLRDDAPATNDDWSFTADAAFSRNDTEAFSVKLPEGSFMDPSLPVTTGVNARMVVVDKPAGAAVFSRSTESVSQSASEWLSDTVIADEVEKRISGFSQQPPIRIRDTAFGQLPGVARNDDVAGAVHDGAIYLFRDRLGDRAAVQRTLFHELFHFGLRKFLTKEQFTEQMMRIYRRDKAIRDEADRWAKTEDGLRAKAFGGTDYATARGVDEALAILAEPNGGLHLNQTVRAVFIRRVTTWLATVADFLSMDQAASYIRSMHNVEAREYIANIFKRLETDAGVKAMDWAETSEPAFSRTADPDSFSVKGATADQLAHYRGMGMQALGRRQIVDLYGDMLPELRQYDTLVQRMDADKNESGAEADALVNDWAKLDERGTLGLGLAKHPGMERKLAELMHDATLAQIDPDKPLQRGDDPGAHKALATKFEALSPKAQEVYRTARDMYANHFKKVQAAIQDRIQRSSMDETSKAKMIAKMDADLFNKLKGVYFPLARFGKYVVVSKNEAGETVSVSRAETLAEANKMRREVVKNSPTGVTVSRVYKDAEFNATRDAVGKGFVSDLMTMLQGQGVGEDVLDSVGQLYLSSLPDLSWAKHGIHRKGTPGFSQDARRAFAKNMFHGARHLAKLRYSDRLADRLMDMEERVKDRRDDEGFDPIKAQQVVDEMNARHETLMNPKTSSVSTALTSMGFVWFLGISPASALVNLSQTALVAYPVMAAKWGFQKAGTALLSASAEVVRAGNDLSKVLKGDELAAFQKAVDDGTIDVTQAHDLAGVAQGEDERVAMAMRPVMRAASFMFHHAEKFNRQATFIAAYRLAKENGADADLAFEQAKKATYDGHFDYSASNRARIMQGNWQKVLFLFKQYGQNMVYTLTRQAYLSMKGMTPEQRTEARKQLGGLLAMHAMAAGALGLPLVGVLLSAASMLGSDDDEPWDAEVALKNAMADAVGPKAAEVMAHGLSRLTPWDLSGRVALNKLILPDIQEGVEGQPLWEKMVTAAAGPVAGIGQGLFKGVSEMGQGQYRRGLESMLPVALKNPVKAMRFWEEGNIDKTTRIPINDEVSASGIAGQALGLRPSEVALATEGKTAIFQYQKAYKDRKSDIMRMYVMARMTEDAEGVQDALEQVRRFNEKNPSRRITVPNLMQSVVERNRRIEQAKQGVYLPKTQREALDAGRFAVVE